MVWVAIFLLVMVLLIGLSLDSAKAFLVSHQLQNAADAAALAGACMVRYDTNQSRQNALEVAYENLADADPVILVDNPGNLPDGDIVIGRYNISQRLFTPTLENVNAVKAVARRTDISHGGPVPLTFGTLVNIDDINITRYAIARTIGGTGAGLIALRPDGIGLLVNGELTFDVNDGDIQVNSADDRAARFIGTPQFSADALNIWGDLDATGGIDPEEFGFDIDTDAPPLPDPLCPNPPEDCLPAPTWNPDNDLADGNTVTITGGEHLLEPGYYSGGFNITGGDITLKPGIYVLGGGPKGKGGLVVGGNANFCAKGVMFYITENGKVDLAGNGSLRITPPEPDITDFCGADFSYPTDLDFTHYERISIFQDRTNTNDAKIVGTNLMDLDGTLYFPNNHVDLTGTGDGFGNQLIAWSIEVSGTGNLIINYDGRNPTPGYMSFLVE